MGIPIRVLIVEDSTDDAELVMRQLRLAGYDPVSERVQTAEAMKTALEREAWHLVVCDYSMPQFDAPTALNLLNQSGRDVPFIVVSGSIGEDIAVAMMKTGAHDYILKQNLTRFAPAVQRELHEAENRRQHRLTEQAKQRLQIERDEFLERLKQENEDLAALTQVTANAISTLDLDELLHVLLERMVEVMHADTATILLADGAELHVRASVGVVNLSDSTVVKQVGEGFAGSVAARKQPLYVEDAAVDPLITDPLIRGRGIRSMLGVPLKRNGTLVGVLHVDWLTVRPCRDREVHLLEITAERCAAAIQNAQLYQEARRNKGLAEFKAALDEHAIVAITDPRGTITYVNEKFCAISKYAREELLGQDHRIINSGHHPKAFIRDLWQTIGSGQVWKGEIKNRAKDGTFYWVATTIVPFLDAHGKPIQYIAIRADITERKQAEERISQLNADLQVGAAQIAEANKELESFAYSVAHDLRAPLRHVHSYVEMLQRATAGQLPEKSQRYVKTISEASTEMGRLIDDLLSFSRMGRAEMGESRVDLNALIQDTIRGLQTTTTARHIVWQVTPLPAVVGDPSMLKQVMTNLLDNAVKYSRQRDPARIEIGAAGEEDGRVVLFVRDNGAGFDMRYVHKLFGVFQRLHRPEEFEGTGIGLATVRRIVARHGGRVWAEGAPDQGATFYVTLKRSASA